MKALDPHRVTTVTDPTIDGAVVEGLELVVVLVEEGALDFLRDGTIDDTLVGTIVVVADFAMVGFTVGVVLVEIGVATIDGAVVILRGRPRIFLAAVSTATFAFTNSFTAFFCLLSFSL